MVAAICTVLSHIILTRRGSAELDAINRHLLAEIEERKRAQEEVIKSREVLIRQERMRVAGQLASGIAHDLNNTLNVVQLRLALMARDSDVTTRHAANLESITRAIGDAVRTIDRVHQVGNSHQTVVTEAIELPAVINEAVELARTTIEESSSLRGAPTTIEVQVPASLPPVKGVASEFGRVFLNLVLNARDAMEHGGKITIAARAQAQQVVVEVTDEGGGIKGEYLDHIFEPFFSTKPSGGSGLGLSITRGLMESIGGSVSAANRLPRGAVFTLLFPIFSAHTEVPPATHDIADDSQCRFLLIDDNNENLTALRELLVTKGYEADVADSGAKALGLIEAGHRYDIVMCDLGMPGMNGWEVAGRIHELRPDLRVYIITGWGHHLRREAPANPAVSGVISKPLDPAEIERIVKQAQAA